MHKWLWIKKASRFKVSSLNGRWYDAMSWHRRLRDVLSGKETPRFSRQLRGVIL
ncbi:MAG TPA: hypothetical protein VJJ02_00575 [Candidatus Paceibacterota bacterium]